MTFLSGLLAFALSSCAITPSAPPIPRLTELAPTAPRVQRLQIFSAESEFQLTAVLAHTHDRLQLAVLSPNGQRLFTLLHDHDGTRYLPDSTISPPVTAPWLASRLGWALWPKESLESAFANTPWSLHSVANRREVLFRHRIQASILLSDACTVIEDFQMKVSMSISPLDSSKPCAPL
ncbi:DUF3261 domain-containing protein [Granulosicoccus antarcticus]|nr:DUF3261 domain-containing protein [Granulosicoccus antarcticus]